MLLLTSLTTGCRVGSSGHFPGDALAIAGSSFTSSSTNLLAGSASSGGTYDLLHTLRLAVSWLVCVPSPLLLLDARRHFAARSRNLSRTCDPVTRSRGSVFCCVVFLRLFMLTVNCELPLF